MTIDQLKKKHLCKIASECGVCFLLDRVDELEYKNEKIKETYNLLKEYGKQSPGEKAVDEAWERFK